MVADHLFGAERHRENETAGAGPQPHRQEPWLLEVSDALHRDFGKMEARIENLTQVVEAMAETVNEMKEKIDRVEGGWRALMWLSATIATVSAFAGGILTAYWPR